MRWSSALLFLTVLPATARAAESASMGAAMLQMSWALLVVVGLILAVYALARKRMLLGKIGGRAITVVELRPLLPKTTLALIEVRGREYLLGISANNIQLLADLSDPPKNPERAAADFETVLAQTQ
ncbi:hypothetical protein Despr_2235 [Desulfobulbus propionicus DSM 2032]|jgi:flagellar protein FliO/FliZ|uniref:Flagellar protein n=1 Tax=Desulfobulbus propionicus (strain ATCC 33891 / DSM 2032 / VKM B-1956 / 1pr3) TaxID=577650 RepID=A0A7U3YN07_DESPD|nr:flagellar biosynthetic protein FliO [Desulfobulbus propionicus]ADW18379.1 hypothetical protein Despr_2235 [Desulfobulbus propionicus DSM 2032]